ncbi:putative acyl-CoA dehydrogenase [Burkholderia pseudomallei]|nr:putative acyl-CoA dehydrogenase [Burkholderia pseudomallei]
MPPNISIISPVASTARLQTQNFAAGATMRVHAGSPRSNACASRIASASAASLSSARSASTARISGCSASARPNA